MAELDYQKLGQREKAAAYPPSPSLAFDLNRNDVYIVILLVTD